MTQKYTINSMEWIETVPGKSHSSFPVGYHIDWIDHPHGSYWVWSHTYGRPAREETLDAAKEACSRHRKFELTRHLSKAD